MADPRYFRNCGPFSLAQIIAASDAEPATGEPDLKAEYADVSPLAEATAAHVSFIDNRKYLGDFKQTRAGVVLAASDLRDEDAPGRVLLISKDPYRAYARVASLFYPRSAPQPGVASSAIIDETTTIPADCRVDHGAVIGAGVSLGPRCHIGANTVIGEGVVLGADCAIGPSVSLMCCLIDDRVIIHPGVKIGQDGFGFAPGADGHLKVPQLGRVVIGHDVEIGANTTIDRGTGPDTEIGAGAKIDNLVQIGHNVRLGRGCLVVSQVGISGSTVVEDFVMIGGQAGFVGHLTIGTGSRIGARSGVIKDVRPGETVAGYPARPIRDWLKQNATMARLAKKRDG